MRILKSDYLLFALFLIAGGVTSVVLKYDTLWDFANYHYYNAWALVNGRLWEDPGMGGINAFLNPLIELPLYYMIQYFNDYPNVIHFFQGLYFGALEFVLYLFAKLLFDARTWKGRGAIALVLLIGATGFAVNSQIGASSNEIQVALLILTGFYILYKELFYSEKIRNSVLFVSSLIMGIAMGLKFTSVTYCLAAGILLIVYYRCLPSPLKNIIVFALGGLLGFVMINGFWMYLLWEQFGNPVFPFANKWFKSEWMPLINYADYRFRPENWIELLFYPVVWSLGKYHHYDAMVVTDSRPLILFVILIGYLLVRLRAKIKTGHFFSQDKGWNFLISFFLVSYIIWLCFFGITRYYIVLEVLGAIFIVKAIFVLVPKNFWMKAVYFSLILIVLFTLLATMIFSNNWGARRSTDHECNFSDGMVNYPLNQYATYDKYMEMEKITLPEDSLVLFSGMPNAFILPLLNKYSSVRGMEYIQYHHIYYATETEDKRENFDLFDGGPWRVKKEEMIKKYGKPKALVVTTLMEKERLNEMATNPYIEDMYCRILKNNVIMMTWICVDKQKAKEYLGEEPKELKESQVQGYIDGVTKHE